MRMRNSIWRGLLPVMMLLLGCPKSKPAPVNELTLHGARAAVHITLDPFAFEVLRPDGEAVLRSLPAVNGGPYGGPAATADNYAQTNQRPGTGDACFAGATHIQSSRTHDSISR